MVCLFFVGIMLQACAGMFYGQETDKPLLTDIKSIAVLPMDRAVSRPGQEKATCALSDTVFDTNNIPPEASSRLSEVLTGLLKDDSRFKFVPEGECIGFLNAFLKADVKASQLRLIQSFGRELGVDAVLYGKLYRFEDRIGSSYSVEKPASVAFSLHLIRVSDSVVLWQYTFDEKQKPLTENLLNTKLYRESGLKWLTADQLANYGLTNALKELKRRLP
ncbi:MAG: hypothetical protein ACUVQV_01205 [Dissulfurimicrobium sp.]|uniref:hypothetical protein n=1 Tax=Dissulfurimicrobium sp. TaxID=2022436 RepID=UPI00404AA859